MTIRKNECWGLIPARGGSKSIPLKNIAEFAGVALIDYNIRAAAQSVSLSRTICTTDSDEIAAHCRKCGIDVHPRPDNLGADDTAVIDVILYTLDEIEAREGSVPEFVALLQPTSPFLRTHHIDNCVAELRDNPAAGSAQTVITPPHNSHAYNQRQIIDGEVTFRFAEERAKAYNKQTKPEFWLFGNLVVFRVDYCRAQKAVFATPSRAVPIEQYYGFDADGPEDFQLGELLIKNNFVELPHME